MPEESFEEKSEEPSEKRRQDAREKGTVAKSTEVNSVLVLMASMAILRILSPWIYHRLSALFISIFTMVGNPPQDMDSLVRLMRETVIELGIIVLPVIGTIMLVGVFANFIQIGLLFTLNPLIPKLEKIDPISGTIRMFSMRSLVELLKNIAKLVLVGVVAYLSIKSKFTHFIGLADTSVPFIWTFMLKAAYDIVMQIALAMIVIAVLDFAYQRFEHERKMRMTRQEVKEERKQMEGDPQIKARVRALQREMARRRMMQEVPKATVVVTNPTYIAIALRYEPSESSAPVVLAKGKRIIAERIREIARQHDIPIVEDKPLARSMYDKIAVGLEIPMEFFTAVAEILAYVFKLKNRKAA